MKKNIEKYNLTNIVDCYLNRRISKKSFIQELEKLIQQNDNEINNLNNEIARLKSLIKIKDAEISSFNTISIKRGTFLQVIFKELEELKKHEFAFIIPKIIKIQNKILREQEFYEDYFKYFFNHFLINNNIKLLDKLKDQNFSDTEKEVCCLVLLNFNNKNIAEILNVTAKSVESMKYRIKKKLGLNKKESLANYLNVMVNTTSDS